MPEQAPAYPVPSNEEARLSALAAFHLLDTPPEQEFDRLAELAARLFKVPIVLISLLDRDRQFLKARVGMDVCETSREVSFCAHAIMQDDIFLVPDAMKDPRFATNPLVLGPPFIRFYAGKPLTTANGEKLGTVCLIDHEPRDHFGDEDRRNLTDLAALVMDRMELRRLDFATTISRRRFENIAATSPDAIICSNAREEVTFWNRAAQRLFGYTAEEMAHQHASVIVPESWRRIYEAEIARLQRGERMELADRTIVLSGRRKDGSEFPAEYSLSTWDEGGTTSIGAIVRDITERRRNEERLFRLASLDPLTDLPNRGAWQSQVAATLATAEPVSVLLLDLDGFKDVNDTLGHSAGDAVLREVGGRIQRVCERAIMVARLGGDEFVVLLRGDDLGDAERAAGEVVRAIAQPFEFAGERIDVGASIGIALAPEHGRRAEDLLGAADLALYKAKAAGKGRYELFRPSFRDVAIARRAFETELRLAYERGEFEVFYQPQVATDGGAVTGAEALLRWRHPQRGLLTPAHFVKVLGESPVSQHVGEWVLREACREAARWRQAMPGFRMGVNLFETQFRSVGLIETVTQVLADAGLAPEALELEIVENTLMRDDQATLHLLQQLRAVGIGLAFDDYGTGFASLSLLKRYPVTRLKIDRSFIRNVIVDEEDAAVVRAVIYLGRSFGLEVTAEGVETSSQLEFLRANRCPEAQGYLFGKPAPAAKFERMFLGMPPAEAGAA